MAAWEQENTYVFLHLLSDFLYLFREDAGDIHTSKITFIHQASIKHVLIISKVPEEIQFFPKYIKFY